MNFSTSYATLDNGRKALEKCMNGLSFPSAESDLIVIFFSESYDQLLIQNVALDILDNVPFIGIQVPGIVTKDRIIRKGVGVMAMKGEEIDAKTTLRKIEDEEENSGREIGKNLYSPGSKNGTVLIFPSVGVNEPSKIIRGIYDKLGPNFNFMGGIGSLIFGPTDLGENHVAVALFDEPTFTIKTGHGWRPMSEPLVVTSSHGSTIKGIDGRPALKRYSEVLESKNKGDFSDYRTIHPLGVPNIYGAYLVREILSTNEDGSLTTVSEIPEGAVVNVMEARIEDLIQNTEEMLKETAEEVKDPEFALIINCVSRQDLLEENGRGKEEINIIKKKLGKELPIIGALTYGEIGSFSGIPALHNKTIALGTGSGKGRKNESE